jgi:hypothetical protein
MENVSIMHIGQAMQSASENTPFCILRQRFLAQTKQVSSQEGEDKHLKFLDGVDDGSDVGTRR